MRAVIFDIGGVLELTPSTGWTATWESRLSLPPGEIGRRCADVWAAGSTGEITESQVRTQLAAHLHLGPDQLDALLADLWHEYLGTPNEELIAYVRTLRGRCHLGILSNSFVGAREREQPLLDLVDDVIYSHELGINKPDPRAFAAACTGLRTRPDRCLLVDDNQPNIEAARAFGMQATHFTGNPTAIAAIEHFLQPSTQGEQP